MRFPLADLIRVLADSDDATRRRLAVSGAMWATYHTRGLSELQADRLAARAGYHPAEVWPEWADMSAALAEKACVECGEGYVPHRSTQRYCSKRCNSRVAQREWKRRRYANDPAFADKLKAQRRAYYEECRDYELARQKRYDAGRRAQQRRDAA